MSRGGCTLMLVYAVAIATLHMPVAHSTLQLEPREQHRTWKDAEVRQRREVFSVDKDVRLLQDNNETDTCLKLEYPSETYESSCDFVKENCHDKHVLFNYLAFATCDLGETGGFIFLTIWLMYLLLLLSTTVDNFFVPVLQLMANKLRLPPSVAGMTLLALGNGAPDIFVAFSALQDDDLPLMLGALLGAGLFITAVVLGTVLLFTPTKTYNLSPFDFMRNLLAFVLVLGIIVAVSFDGKVTLAEAILFPFFYVAYVFSILGFTYMKKWWNERRNKRGSKIYFGKVSFSSYENNVLIRYSPEPPEIRPTFREKIEKSIRDDEGKKPASIILPQRETKKLELVGLTLPKGKLKKIIFIMEWPFSLLRWLTIPPCSHDGEWSVFHFSFAVFSPIPMSLFLLIVASHWSGFTETVGNSPLPLVILVLLCVSPLCIILFFALSWKHPPHWAIQIFLMMEAFAMSITWLYIIANEVVSVLQAMGLLAGVSTAILGLTVLAIGNSVPDWVSDTLVAFRGKPEMALASCFGAPLITHVLGLSFALLPKVLEDGNRYTFNIKEDDFVHVKLVWIFFGIVLLGSAIVFPVFRFNPPKEYSLILIYVYGIFMLFSVLVETDIMDIAL